MLSFVSLVRQSPGRSMTPMTDASDPHMPTDEELVLKARAGSQPAFESLVRRYQKPLYFLCIRYVRDHDVAADIVQRSFIRVLEKLDVLRDAQIFRSWLFRIGVNLSLNQLRDHARFVEEDGSLVEETGSGAPEADTLMERREDSDALHRAVALLPTKQRMTLELRIHEELSFRDIAVALDTTEGAAKVNFHYAVRRLRSLLTRQASGQAKGK